LPVKRPGGELLLRRPVRGWMASPSRTWCWWPDLLPPATARLRAARTVA